LKKYLALSLSGTWFSYCNSSMIIHWSVEAFANTSWLSGTWRNSLF
jgi:hypothetical protein